jgi:tRNA-dihydrouridine synthase B
MLEHYGKYGAIIFRKHLHTYSKAGYQGASAFRNRVNTIEEPSEMREVVTEFFSQPYLNGV